MFRPTAEAITPTLLLRFVPRWRESHARTTPGQVPRGRGDALDFVDIECELPGDSNPEEVRLSISPYYLALAGTICIGVVAQTLFKIGATGSPGTMEQLLRVSTIVGLVLYLASAILYVIALQRMSISVAFPTVSVGYVLIAAIDYFLFKEPIGLLQLGGLVLIIAGVSLLHQSS